MTGHWIDVQQIDPDFLSRYIPEELAGVSARVNQYMVFLADGQREFFNGRCQILDLLLCA